jgi:hypothetical protein
MQERSQLAGDFSVAVLVGNGKIWYTETIPTKESAG